jgi:trehalose 6-phosphate phosphatase
MRNILSARSRPLLRKFVTANVLVGFDFDGTLAPIVSEPGRAAMRADTRKLLRRLTSLCPCIVVSGRSRADVRNRLRGIEFDEIIGNHGIEPWKSSEATARAVGAWIPLLERDLKRFPGLMLEDKRFSVSIHYRRERNKRRAAQAIMELAQRLPEARFVGGKQVVNIVPRGAPHKGSAVERARRKVHCDKVIYVGDDVTDEDVFALAPNGRFLSIRVGAKGPSLARFHIRRQREIDRLLRTMIELRLNSSPVRRAAPGRFSRRIDRVSAGIRSAELHPES